jgi:ubiquinone/menaquinone biosynthesis C-methylase UbiE
VGDPARFWDRVAGRYAARPVRDEAAYEETLARTRAHLPEGGRALEIGCGTGTTALRLAPSLGHLTATDISSEMISIARDKAGDGAGTVVFLRAGLGDEVPGAPFDAVLAFNLLHLLEDLPGALARVRALLVPGGLFVSKSVCLGGRGYLKPLIAALRLAGYAPPVVRFLRPAELEAAIEAAGFEILERADLPASPPSRFVVARLRPAV